MLNSPKDTPIVNVGIFTPFQSPFIIADIDISAQIKRSPQGLLFN